ncbi:MAG TPA: signal peptidase I [Methanomassiliicoccales archaeon]|nr:signal peptidase I [Methanomassiliicoccales archaeon]
MRTRKNGTKTVTRALFLVLLSFILLLAFSPAFGIRFDVVLSGSMSPTIRTGDSVIVKSTSPDDLKAGDIIVFKSPLGNGLVCHRIVLVDRTDGLAFQTKGDGNEDPDPFMVRSDDVIGKVQVTIPAMGYVVQYLRGPFGILLLISLALATILIPEKEASEEKKPKENYDAKGGAKN